MLDQCLKWSKKEAGSLPQSEVECPSPEIFFLFFLSENGEFWCIVGGILCYLELQKSRPKQETCYRPGKSKGAGSPTLATRSHFKPWARCTENNSLLNCFTILANIAVSGHYICTCEPADINGITCRHL